MPPGRDPILAQNPHLIDPTRSYAPSRFLELVADKLAAVEVLFKRHLDSDVPFIHKAGAYISQGGGKRTTKGHYDVPMRDCTVALDNDVIIERGKLTDPKMQVAFVPR